MRETLRDHWLKFGAKQEKERIEALTEKIREVGAKVYDRARPSLWLVTYDGTTHELSEALGLGNDESLGTAVVIPVTAYSGYAQTDLWEWISVHRNGD